MNTREQVAQWAGTIKGLGFRVWLDKGGTYGFISDESESRVLSFGFRDGGSLGGNYGPPSQESGTGWRLDGAPWDLTTAAAVKAKLYEPAPEWTRRAAPRCGSCGHGHGKPSGWQHYQTVSQHLAMYGKSSGYQEI